MTNKEAKKVKDILEWVRDMQLTKAPENVVRTYPGDIPTYYGDCPDCGMQSKAIPIDKQGKTVYQSISFCPRCSTAIDWTEVISKEELEELNDE